LEFEKSVVYEIFPALMDSLHYDLRLYPPPPPKAIYDKQGKYIGIDTTGTEQVIAEYNKRRAELKADSVKLVIAINDSVYPLEKRESSQLLKHFSEHNLKLDSTDLSTNYKIDLTKLRADKKLRFKYLSEFPKGSAIWKKNMTFILVVRRAYQEFSSIQLNHSEFYTVEWVAENYVEVELEYLLERKKING
jgi:hypothetical protein